MPYPGMLHPETLHLCRTLLTCSFTGGTQTQFCVSLCGVSGSWCAEDIFEASECLLGKWFDSKHDFTPPNILLGLLLCLWM